MVRVAVAGGTGNLGRHIVEAITATKKHTVVVLSRSPSNPALEAVGAQIAAVDYKNHASLVTALKGVHTVISVIWTPDDTLATNQLALLDAAVEAGVKRFAPSEWAVASIPDEPITLYRPKVRVAEAVAKSGLEWTKFENGVFMNYFVSGTKGVGYLSDLKLVVDVENATAKVPGTGDEEVCFTRGEDIALFVAASLDLPKWPARSRIVGEVLTYNQVIAIAEKVRGRKFDVTYVSVDELRKQLDPNAPSPYTNFFTSALIEIATGRFVYEANINALFPDINPMGGEELMRKWWV